MQLLSGKSQEGVREDFLRYRDAGAVRAGHQQSQGDAGPAGAAVAVTFSALDMLCIMYAWLAENLPGMDMGVDMGEVWEMTEKLLEAW